MNRLSWLECRCRTQLRSAAVAAALLLVATPALSQETTPISEQQAVTAAMHNNPSLSAAVIEQAGARERVVAEDNLYVPRLILDAGAMHSERPSLTSTGGVIVTESDSLIVGSEIRHTFPWGTSMSFELDTSISRTTVPAVAGAGASTSLGPGYGLTGRFTVVQPLLRGLGSDVGEASLRQAELGRTAAERAKDHAASLLLRDVAQAYWELWYASRATAIQQSAIELASRRRDETKARLEAGATARVALLPFETRVGELEQTLLVAQAQRRRRSVALVALLGDDRANSDGLVAAAANVPAADPPPDRDATLKRAMLTSAELARVEAELAMTEDQARIAGENERPRLDATAWVQSDGLGNRAVPPAFEQFGKLEAISGFVGAELELPVTGQRRGAQRRAAELASDAHRERLRATRQQIASSVDNELVSLDVARRRIDIADRVAKFAKQQAKATQERLDEGAAITLEVHEAEDSLRRAELTIERARVDALLAQIELDHLTGVLLKRYGDLVPRKPRAVPVPLGPPQRF